MRRDRRRLGALLGYVRYALNPALQAEAVRLGHHLSARLPAIVDYLTQPTPGSRRSAGSEQVILAWVLPGRKLKTFISGSLAAGITYRPYRGRYEVS